jgi:hypothetical protein
MGCRYLLNTSESYASLKLERKCNKAQSMKKYILLSAVYEYTKVKKGKGNKKYMYKVGSKSYDGRKGLPSGWRGLIIVASILGCFVLLENFGVIPPRIGVICSLPISPCIAAFSSGTTRRIVFAQPPTQFHRLSHWRWILSRDRIACSLAARLLLLTLLSSRFIDHLARFHISCILCMN